MEDVNKTKQNTHLYLLEMKTTMSEIKNILDEVNNTLDTAEK